jgi:hypothetical protein
MSWNWVGPARPRYALRTLIGDGLDFLHLDALSSAVALNRGGILAMVKTGGILLILA